MKFNIKTHNEMVDSILSKVEYTAEDRGLLNLEWQMCKEDILRFLRYCQIVEAPIPGQTGGGVRPLELWRHIRQILSIFLTKKLITVLKARQIGISTIVAAYVLWYVLFNEGAVVLLFSKGKDEAKELLAKSRRIYNQLPEFLKQELYPSGTEEIGFPVMKSMIKTLPSTTSAGIGYTASIIVCDEHAEHEYADENYVSAKPVIDGGRQFISVFTENAWDKGNLATTLYEDAKKDKNGFTPVFFPYDVIPGRDEAWYAATERSIPDRDLKGLTPELYMSKNYPHTEEEALSTPQTVAAFDKGVLREMKEEADKQPRITISQDGLD